MKCKDCLKIKNAHFYKTNKQQNGVKSLNKKSVKPTGLILPPGTSVSFDEEDDDTRFIADLGAGIRVILCGDGGSEVNLVPMDAVEALLKCNKEVKAETLEGPVTLRISGPRRCRMSSS